MTKTSQIREPAQEIYNATATLAAQNTSKGPGILAAAIAGLILLGQSGGSAAPDDGGGYEYKPFNPSLDESLMWVQ